MLAPTFFHCDNVKGIAWHLTEQQTVLYKDLALVALFGQRVLLKPDANVRRLKSEDWKHSRLRTNLRQEQQNCL